MEIRTGTRDGYVHLELFGRASLQGAIDALPKALQACHDAGTPAVLVDVRAVEGEATVTDRYYLGRAIAGAVGPTLRIALVCRPDQWMEDRPLENTAVNRGVRFLSTTDMDAAAAWLRSEADPPR